MQAATQLVPEIPAKGIAEGQRPASPTRGADQGGLASSRAPEGVGEEDPQAMSGFYVGLAPANLRPPKGTDAGDMLIGKHTNKQEQWLQLACLLPCSVTSKIKESRLLQHFEEFPAYNKAALLTTKPNISSCWLQVRPAF